MIQNWTFKPTRWATYLLLALMHVAGALSATEKPVKTNSASTIVTQKVEFEDYELHFAHSGNLEAPGILFIHGTPGSWKAFRSYLSDAKLQQDYFMVSVDRSGWGKSGVPELGVAGSFDNQARSIVAVLNRFPQKQWLLVGHSLGASLAPEVLLRAPESVSAMLLLAGSLQPKLGKPRWYNRFANSWMFGWMVPANLKASNDEIMLLEEELLALESALVERTSNVQVVVVQGMRDRLVSPKNLAYVAKTWPAIFPNLEIVELPDAGHFLPWNNTEQIVQIIRELKF